MKLILLFLSFFYFTCNAYQLSNIKISLLQPENVINFLTAYEMRMLDYENENKIKRNKLQKLINLEHEISFDDIKRKNKYVLTALCSYKREGAMTEPTYLVHHEGNFARIVPVWNYYFSEVMSPFTPKDALEICQKYNFPDKISNINEIYNLYRFSKLIQVSKSL